MKKLLLLFAFAYHLMVFGQKNDCQLIANDVSFDSLFFNQLQSLYDSVNFKFESINILELRHTGGRTEPISGTHFILNPSTDSLVINKYTYGSKVPLQQRVDFEESLLFLTTRINDLEEGSFRLYCPLDFYGNTIKVVLINIDRKTILKLVTMGNELPDIEELNTYHEILNLLHSTVR